MHGPAYPDASESGVHQSMCMIAHCHSSLEPLAIRHNRGEFGAILVIAFPASSAADMRAMHHYWASADLLEKGLAYLLPTQWHYYVHSMPGSII